MKPIQILLLLIAAGALAACQSDPEPEAPVDEQAAAESAPEPQTEPEPEARREVRRREDRPERPAEPEQSTIDTDGIDPSRELPRLEGQLDSDSYGPTMIIDGSSPDAFLQSLELIASESSAQQYGNIDSALRSLETYSMTGRDLAAFYEQFDGLTGEEIIERAQNRRSR